MSVFFDTTVVHGGKVVVDDVHHIANINTTSGNSSCNQNRRITRAESSHRSFSLLLCAVTMDGSDRKLHVEEEIIQVVRFLAAVHEDDGANSGHFLQEPNKKLALLMSLSLEDNLLDIGRGASRSTYSESDVRGGKVFLGQIAGTLGEGGREEPKLDVTHILF